MDGCSGLTALEPELDTLLAEEKGESSEGMRRLAAKLLQAQENERRRVARELHDVINQKLAVLVIEVGALARDPNTPSKTCDELKRLRDDAERLTDDVRSLSHQLHPATLEHLGLLPALRGFCRQFAEREGIAVTFESSSKHVTTTKEIALCLFRIAQEALRNAAKHAKATELRVTLNAAVGGLTLEISDDGIGFQPPSRGSAGIGVASMRERAHLAGADFQIRSAPGLGTTVSVETGKKRGMSA